MWMLGFACSSLPPSAEESNPHAPLALALVEEDRGEAVRFEGNREAAIPPMCYTRTGGTSNPCWVCHTAGTPPQPWIDHHLQLEYAFSEVGAENHWENLFEDRTARIAAISDEDILAYIRHDNYAELRAHLAANPERRLTGWSPDLDLAAGFDAEGFANDGSGWRALRYKPFLGSFWPTNGNTDDAYVRLPSKFRPSRELYQLNLALLEAAVTLDPRLPPGGTFVREVEPVSEVLAGFDLDGDGTLEPLVTEIRALPPTYVGPAADEPLRRYAYPKNTEFAHSVRYVDPDAPNLLSARMKELRYSRNVRAASAEGRGTRFDDELEERSRGLLPQYGGSSLSGLRGLYGWMLQGWIEDPQGRLRLQTYEEHRFCMGCHGAIGVTVDATFSLPRKLPGAEGWRPQDLRGIPDVPQAGHAEPEYLEYFRRNRGADELRGNDEMLARYFREEAGLQEVIADEVRKAAAGGSEDLAWLLTPSRERALLLNKAYRVTVLDQDFRHGRDAVVTPMVNVHRSIENGDTENGGTGLFFSDGVLALDWASGAGSR
jgi:hypothetical protein